MYQITACYGVLLKYKFSDTNMYQDTDCYGVLLSTA